MANIIFQSSLPRSGSTLLQNILAQNPLIYSTPTSNLINFILGARIGYNKDREVMLDRVDEWKTCYYDFCREGIQGYIKSPDIEDGTQDNANLRGITTQQRVETWLKSVPVGYALTKLQQSLLDKTADNFLFLRYEDLCTSPEEVISEVYKYLKLDKYKHNYNHVEQVTEENDALHGIYGDHTIRSRVQALPNDSLKVLGQQTYDWIYENNKGYFEIFNYSK